MTCAARERVAVIIGSGAMGLAAARRFGPGCRLLEPWNCSREVPARWRWPQRWRTWGAITVKNGDIQRAVDAFSRALGLYAHAGAAWDAGRVRGPAEGTGRTPPPGLGAAPRARLGGDD